MDCHCRQFCQRAPFSLTTAFDLYLLTFDHMSDDDDDIADINATDGFRLATENCENEESEEYSEYSAVASLISAKITNQVDSQNAKCADLPNHSQQQKKTLLL